MFDSLLFASYTLAVSGMAYNTAQIKYQDDFEREVREYREYDYANETLRREKLDGAAKCIVLAKYHDHQMVEAKKMEEAKADTASQQDQANDSKKVLFQRHIAIFNVTDPARHFTAKVTKDEEFSMVFANSEKNKQSPLEVQFNRGSKV